MSNIKKQLVFFAALSFFAHLESSQAALAAGVRKAGVPIKKPKGAPGIVDQADLPKSLVDSVREFCERFRSTVKNNSPIKKEK